MSDARVRRWEARLRRHAAERLLALATAFQAQAKRDYSVPNPAPHATPAPPTAFPRARTFNLRDAISIAPATVAEIAAAGSVRVGVLKGAFYGAVLARRGWLGLLDSYHTARPRLARLAARLGAGPPPA